MKKLGTAAILLAGFALAGAQCDNKSGNSYANGESGNLPNPAMQAPDQVAWQVFAQVTAGKEAPLFESWASDTDTFNSQGAAFPSGEEAKDGLDLRPPALPTMARAGGAASASAAPPGHAQAPAAAVARQPAAEPEPTANTAAAATNTASPASGSGIACPVTGPLTGIYREPGSGTFPPVGGNQPVSIVGEEVRRNQAAFDYIISNGLNSVKGLQAAFKANLTVSFPVDSIEVKTNWIPVSCIPVYYPTVNANEVSDVFYVTNDSNGNPHALLAMHVISKQVPNWTWATFEHQLNPGRCDWMGCKDSFGATTPFVAPVDNQGQNPGSSYPACTKTPQAGELMAGSSAVFGNYCLKGSQTDFTDNTGLAIRLGNSVIEYSFVNQASCMTCHGGAGFNAQGARLNPVNTDIGPIPVSYYWTAPASPAPPPFIPPYQGQPGLNQIGVSADFVWSIPFCAYDDTSTPVKQSSCASGGR